MKTIWYPAPLTNAENAATIVATDTAGQAETVPWRDVWESALPEDDKRMWR